MAEPDWQMTPDRSPSPSRFPRGAVVETLVERGFHVYAIKPPSSSIVFATATV